MRGKFLQGRLPSLPWPKFLVARMLTRDLFVVANLLVKYCSYCLQSGIQFQPSYFPRRDSKHLLGSLVAYSIHIETDFYSRRFTHVHQHTVY